MVYVPDTVLGYRYYPDTTFIFSNVAFTNSCTTNSLGFPGNDFSPKKQEGIFRILLAGVSDDTGFVSDGSYSYAQRLNQMFQDHHYPVEIINCSTDGSDRIVRNMELIKKEGIDYDPDLILLRDGLPLKDAMRHRMTYRGCIIYTPYLQHVEPTKQYIDDVLDNQKHWFKVYDRSYIFRYYLKIYFDIRRLEPEHKFVKFSESIFGYGNLMYLLMHVRKEVRNVPRMVFDIDIFERNELCHTNNTSDPSFRRLASFSSGTQEQKWADIDLTDCFSANDTKDTLELLFNTELSKGRTVAFASGGGSGMFAPRLHISGRTGDTIVFPVESGSICFDSSIQKDTIVWVCNDIDSTKSKIAYLKFDMSGVQSFETCDLKLYIKHLSLGEKAVIDRPYTLSESADSLKSLQTFLENKGIQFSVFDTYTTSTKYDKSFARRQINYINLDIPFKKEYSFGEQDGHSTQAGHQAIAEAFFKTLVEDVIPKQFLQPHKKE